MRRRVRILRRRSEPFKKSLDHAMPSDVRRNDPCPCGSGAKYKNCCQGKMSWRDNRMVTGAGIALVLLVGLLLIGIVFSSGGDSERRDCPPGQVWSEDHQHCH